MVIYLQLVLLRAFVSLVKRSHQTKCLHSRSRKICLPPRLLLVHPAGSLHSTAAEHALYGQTMLSTELTWRCLQNASSLSRLPRSHWSSCLCSLLSMQSPTEWQVHYTPRSRIESVKYIPLGIGAWTYRQAQHSGSIQCKPISTALG